MKLQGIRQFMFGTIRGRLVLGVALVHAVMMTLFIADLTLRQRAILLDRQEADATALSQSLSTSASAWLAADDIAGLQELVEAQRRYPELIFAILTDKGGRILAHTDSARNGEFLLDLPSEVRQTIISKTPVLVDIAVPSILGGRHVGWVRIGIGQKVAREKLTEITFDGALYTLAAILTGSIIAWLMGRRITARLYAVQDTINRVRTGDQTARSAIVGTDEAASIASEFNALLDTLAEREAKLNVSEENFRRLIEESPLAIAVTAGTDNAVELLNNKFTSLFGYTKEDIPNMADWWPLAYPDEQYRAEVRAEWFARVEKAARISGSMEPMEATVICRGGLQRQIEFHMSFIGEHTLTTFIDITERKQAEDALRKNAEMIEEIFSMTTTCIAYLDCNFTFIRVNNKYAESDGKTPEYFIGKNHFDLYPNEENEAIFRKVVESGEQYIADAKTFQYKKHRERGISHWDWSLTPVKDSSGKVETLILSLVNVTDRIKAQENLSKLNEELEARVLERTAELEIKNTELEKMNKLFVGRELRMVELKERIKELEREDGQ